MKGEMDREKTIEEINKIRKGKRGGGFIVLIRDGVIRHKDGILTLTELVKIHDDCDTLIIIRPDRDDDLSMELLEEYDKITGKGKTIEAVDEETAKTFLKLRGQLK